MEEAVGNDSLFFFGQQILIRIVPPGFQIIVFIFNFLRAIAFILCRTLQFLTNQNQKRRSFPPVAKQGGTQGGFDAISGCDIIVLTLNAQIIPFVFHYAFFNICIG